MKRSYKMSSLKDAWALVVPYWKSPNRLFAWSMVVGIILFNLLFVHSNVLVNDWSKDFFDCIENKKIGQFYSLIGHFFILVAYFLVAALTKFFLVAYLSIHWQRWLTSQYVSDWLRDQAYYKMQMLKDPTDNPDQRIAEDIGSFISTTLLLTEGLFSAFVTIVAFAGILWTLSANLPLPFLEKTFIPGSLFWASLFYSGIGTYIMILIGRPLIKINYNQEKYKADFRYSLVRLRENTESVAFYKGESQEKEEFYQRFQKVVLNYYQIIRQSIYINLWRNVFINLDTLFPFFITAPNYFKGLISFGVVMQVNQAFMTIQKAFSFIIEQYFSIAQWQTVIWRLGGFHRNLQEIYALQNVPYAAIQVDKNSSRPQIDVNLTSICLPSGEELLKNIHLSFSKGQHTLLIGASGTGKSTFLRVLSGIWSFGYGEINFPKDQTTFFLSQRPYIPLGSLKTALLYPTPLSETPQGIDFENILKKCKLSHLIKKLEEVEDWSRILSLGEQQRLSIARVLIHKPEWLFLDEATSSLDEEMENYIYTLLHKELPLCTCISVGHRSTLYPFHKKILLIKEQEISEVKKF